MKHKVIYHWWAHDSDPHKHCKNRRSPIILSIATLRAQNPDIEIDVLDCTKQEDEFFDLLDGREEHNDPQECSRWGSYPKDLKFNVWSQELRLEKDFYDKPGYKHLSRLFDLNECQPLMRRHAMNHWGMWEIPEDQIVIYSDADVFWFKDPLPLECDGEKVAFNGHNTGFFYYKPISKTYWKFIDIFKNYTKTALYNENFRQELKKYVGYDDWYYVFDEMTTSYMFHEHRELFDKINTTEHMTARDLNKDGKMFHANGSMMHNHLAERGGEKEHCRGLLCLTFFEFYEALKKVLSFEQICDIFPLKERECFSFFDSFDKIKSTKKEDGLFYIHEMLNPPTLMV
jgi:hypothetical protein